MSQQQQQKTELTATSGFEEKVTKQKTTSQENNIETAIINIEDTLKKYKITKNMNKNDVKELLLDEYLDETFNDYIKDGHIKKDENGKYSWGIKKNLTKEDILDYLYEKDKTNINNNIEKRYQNVQLYFRIQQRKNDRNERQQEKAELQKSNADLLIKREQLVNKLEQKNNELLQTMYKQSKLESQMRTEIAQQQFQQQNIGLQYDKLKQGLESQAIQKEGLISQNRAQLQTSLSQQMQNQQNINSLKQQYEATKIQHSDAVKQANIMETQKQLMEQQNKISSQTLQQTKELRQDINSNFRNMTSLVNDLGKAQIDAIKQGTQAQLSASQQTQEQIKQASAENRAGQEAIISAINGNAAQLSALNQNVNNLNNSLNDLTSNVQNLNNNMNNLGKKFADVPGVPPGCDPAILRRLGCSGSGWNMTPEITNATNNKGQTGINIFRCNAGGHYCATDGGYGQWNSTYPSGYY